MTRVSPPAAVAGAWALVSIDSFQAVTGDKVDLWLVYTVGLLICVTGAVLVAAAELPLVAAWAWAWAAARR